jgi:hypothetical protein
MSENYLFKLLIKNSTEGLKIVDPMHMTFQDYEVYLHVRSNADLRDDDLK